MKKKKNEWLKFIFAVVFMFTFLAMPRAADLPGDVLSVKASITGKMLVSHIDFLSSDYCRGRDTGEPGMGVAAKYITTVLSGADIRGAGDAGGYFQSVRIKTISLGEGNALILEETAPGNAKMIKNARLEWDFLPVIISAQMRVTAPVVFAGYGITAPEHRYDDYKNIDATGKIVLVMRHEPGENDPESPFEGQKNSKYGTLLTKILNAQAHGAVGILFTTDPLNHDDRSVMRASSSTGTRWTSLRKKRMKDDEDLKYMRFRPRMRIIGDDLGVKIPAALIDGKLADDIMGENHSLKDIQQRIDRQMKPQPVHLLRKTVTMDIRFHEEPVSAYNIVAKVEGSDPALKNEVVMVGAHYDHVGKDNRGQVYPGADDNASGTAVVMELARAFNALKQKPKRTILFILFTAEEKSLLGARYYVKNPLVPLEKTVALINLDMVGRNDVNQMSVLGKYQYPKLFNIIEAANKKSVNFELNFSVESFIRNSDHFPFMREGVPYLMFNSGSHDELHTPRDTVDLILAEKVEKNAHLVFLSLWEIGNLPAGTRLDGK